MAAGDPANAGRAGKCLGSDFPNTLNFIEARSIRTQLREMKIEDLLGRTPVNLILYEVSNILRNKVVLGTGSNGSIGSELYH